MYHQLLEKLFSSYPMYHKIGSSAYKESLENIEQLADITAHPDKQFKTIHIAGTNGKGSVANLLASYCQECGLKTGLYTSPHLVNFTERIKINGKEIKPQEILDFFAIYKVDFEALEPSFFEITTILAFWYFAQQKVDIAIIETGLGGRLDATNIITPVLAVITNISKDHTNLLGETLLKIAFEKAGIIKDRVPVVVGESHVETAPVFKTVAESKLAPLYCADQQYKIDKNKDTITVSKNGKTLFTLPDFPLQGDYQLKNIATFMQATALLPFSNTDDYAVHQKALMNVVKNCAFRGRWQLLSTKPYTICDVGHNPDGIKAIDVQLSMMPFPKIHFVIGMVNDKDIHTVLSILNAENRVYYVCNANINRALPATALCEKMTTAEFNTVCCTSVEDAYHTALHNCLEDEMIFIGGSCFVVGELLEAIEKKKSI
ncbi:MAG: bifunctional folylpolyglutamate synthase/dihydrofolate synthase [Bacteroidales bacterium]|jgi:dihydrofolate synthase/folylpolyglutamate synthase|nr:bifunctional folylpolyglutamate synthase/dihydrofolate synthase [Bacteroidales bacterium]